MADRTVTDSAVDPSGQPDGATSPSLLERVRSRDQAAWRRLVAVYGQLVYGWCLRAGLQPADTAAERPGCRPVGRADHLAVFRIG